VYLGISTTELIPGAVVTLDELDISEGARAEAGGRGLITIRYTIDWSEEAAAEDVRGKALAWWLAIEDNLGTEYLDGLHVSSFSVPRSKGELCFTPAPPKGVSQLKLIAARYDAETTPAVEERITL